MSKRGLKTTILTVAIFAIAFGYVEAAVVVYLRHLFGVTQTSIALKLLTNDLLKTELVREAATIIMLLSLAQLVGKKLGSKIALFFFAFGIWDIFYYVFLKITLGWPTKLTDIDIYFLIPVPWVGPVFIPIVASSITILCSLIYLSKRKL